MRGLAGLIRGHLSLVEIAMGLGPFVYFAVGFKGWGDGSLGSDFKHLEGSRMKIDRSIYFLILGLASRLILFVSQL